MRLKLGGIENSAEFLRARNNEGKMWELVSLPNPCPLSNMKHETVKYVSQFQLLNQRRSKSLKRLKPIYLEVNSYMIRFVPVLFRVLTNVDLGLSNEVFDQCSFVTGFELPDDTITQF